MSAVIDGQVDIFGHVEGGDAPPVSRGEHLRARAWAIATQWQIDPRSRWLPFCAEHKNSRKKCPQEHFDQQAQQAEEHATQVWGGDGWRPA